MIDAASWLREKPFAPAAPGLPPRNAAGDDGCVRRVLISWLIGRPVSAIAKRAGGSPRLVHKVLEKIIYDRRGSLWQRWAGLGLIGFLDTPYADFDATHAEVVNIPAAGYLSPWSALVFCQICHRPIAGMRVMSRSRKFDGSLLRVGESWEEDIRDVPLPEIQVHLVRHFALKLPEIDPPRHATSLIIAGLGTRNPELQSASFRRLKKYGALERRKPWIERIFTEAAIEIQRFPRSGMPELLPIRKGVEIDRQEARDKWMRYLRTGRAD